MRLALALVMVAVLTTAGVAYADRPESLKLDVCHATGSESNPYVLVNVNVNSVKDANNVGGHGQHGDDAWESYTYGGVEYPGQGDMALCEGAPDEPEDTPEPTETEEPEDDPTATPDPTDAPEPTPTDVSEEPTSEPTPDSEDCEIGCEPTATPPVTEEPPTCEEIENCETPEPTPTNVGEPTPTDEPAPTPTDIPSGPEPDVQLPSAGEFVSQTELLNGEPWIVMVNDGIAVWAGHNGVQDSPANDWWKLWSGIEFYWAYGDAPGWYKVVEYIPDAEPTDVQLMYRTDIDYDILLITCRTYDVESNTWLNRLLVYAVRIDE